MGVTVPPRSLLRCPKHNREKSGAPVLQLGLWDLASLSLSLLVLFSCVGLLLRQAAPHSARGQQQAEAASHQDSKPNRVFSNIPRTQALVVGGGRRGSCWPSLNHIPKPGWTQSLSLIVGELGREWDTVEGLDGGPEDGRYHLPCAGWCARDFLTEGLCMGLAGEIMASIMPGGFVGRASCLPSGS